MFLCLARRNLKKKKKNNKTLRYVSDKSFRVFLLPGLFLFPFLSLPCDFSSHGIFYFLFALLLLSFQTLGVETLVL